MAGAKQCPTAVAWKNMGCNEEQMEISWKTQISGKKKGAIDIISGPTNIFF